MPETKLFISASCYLPGRAGWQRQLRSDTFDDPTWTICSHLKVVQELEVVGPRGSRVHSVGELYAATPALSPVVRWHGVGRPALFCYLAHEVQFCLGVCSKSQPMETMLLDICDIS